MTAFSRKESKATFPDGVKVIKSDFSPGSLVEAFKGQDAIVSATSMMDGHEETSIVDAAIKAGVKRFITNDVSSFALSRLLSALRLSAQSHSLRS